MATYYVDSSSTGTDSGTLANPYKTISKVNSLALNPGDQVLFKKGTTYSNVGFLYISRSGTSGSLITYSTYGTGSAPVFDKVGTGFTSVYFQRVNYVQVNGLQITDTTISPTNRSPLANVGAGVAMEGSTHCLLSSMSISLVGAGVTADLNTGISCDYNTFTNNYIYNLRMVYTGSGNNDDYGANGIILSGASNNVISYNTFEGCYATSPDYGVDGGALEYYNSCSYNTAIYNTAINCNGFFENGADSPTNNCSNNVFAYNKIINCGGCAYIHATGSFNVNTSNLQFYNNVIVDTVTQLANYSYMFWSDAAPATGSIVVKNNIFWVTTNNVVYKNSVFNSGSIIHSNNIYRMTTSSVGLPLLVTNQSLFDRSVNLFTSTLTTPAEWNYYPLAGAPSIQYGTNVGITKDFAGNTVSAKPTAGIFQYL